MATQGLFTQGPSVEDLLAKRNKRSFDLQQTLMQQAAQGARDPAKAQAISLLGSTLGRAIAGSMGGEDKELEQRKAAIAAQEAQKQDFVANFLGTSADEQMALAQRLLDQGNFQAAAVAKKAAEETRAAENAEAKEKAEAKRIKEEEDEQEAAEKKAEEQLQATTKTFLTQLDPQDPVRIALENDVVLTPAMEKEAWGSLKVKRSALAQKINEAYGYEFNSPKMQEKMQELMEADASTKITVNVNNDTEETFRELTPNQLNAIQKDILGREEQLRKLDYITAGFDDSYFTVGGKTKAAVGAALDKMGYRFDPEGVAGEFIQYNADKTVNTAQIAQLFNLYRQQITGAAAAVAELARLEKDYLNSSTMGPVATRAMLDSLVDVGKRGLEELKTTMLQGINVTDVVNQETSSTNFNDMTTEELDASMANYSQEQINAFLAANPEEEKKD